MDKHFEGLLLALNAAEMELEQHMSETTELKAEKEKLEEALVAESKQVCVCVCVMFVCM
jgi:hypothetical protein